STVETNSSACGCTSLVVDARSVPMTELTARSGDDRGAAAETAALQAFMLRTRALAALRRNGITTIGQLGELSREDLLEVVNVGVKSVADLSEALGGEVKLSPQDPLSCLELPRPLSPRDREIADLRAKGLSLAENGRCAG